MSKSVLYLTYDGLSDPLGQSQILPYLKGLAKKGHQISILSCEKEEPLKSLESSIHEELKSLNIQWKFVKYTKQPAILSTIWDLYQMNTLAKKWNQQAKFDLVHCRTIIPFPIANSLKKKGLEFLFDFRGFWSQERVDGELWNLKNPIYKVLFYYLQKQEENAYQLADHIVSLTHNAKAHLVKTKAIKADKISVIPCSVDLDHFDYNVVLEEKSQLKTELGLSDAHPTFVYAGSLGTRYKVKEMLQCFKVMLKYYEKANYLFITNSDTQDLKQVAEKLQIQDAVMIVSSSYQDIPKYIALADIALYFIEPGQSGKAVSPTKQAEFFSMGLPIITNDGIGDSTEILKSENAGFICSGMNEANYKQLSNNIDELLALDQALLRNCAKKYFALDKGVQLYHHIYESLKTVHHSDAK